MANYRLNVHVLSKLDPDSVSILRSELDPAIRLTGWDQPPPKDSHILVTGDLEASHLQFLPQLQRVVIPFAGLPSGVRDLLLDHRHIKVHNLHHNDGMTAEMAIALLISAAKFLIPFDHALRNGDWGPRDQPNPSILLDGKTALVLGFGAIGKRVGRACWGLGMKVIGMRRSVNPTNPLDYPAEVVTVNDLARFLPDSHALIITAPGTTETQALIGERELLLMPPGGIVVNVGRGAILDQAALYACLINGHLVAAGLDVWYNYPQGEAEEQKTFPSDYPFHELGNIVMSPHRGGVTRDSEPLRMRALATLLNAALRGETVPNQVDLGLGY